MSHETLAERMETLDASFVALRKICDPRGHDLIDAIENLVRVEAAIGELRPFACHIDESAGQAELHSVKA